MMVLSKLLFIFKTDGNYDYVLCKYVLKRVSFEAKNSPKMQAC